MLKYIFGIDSIVPIDKWLFLGDDYYKAAYLGTFLEAIIFLVDPYYYYKHYHTYIT